MAEKKRTGRTLALPWGSEGYLQTNTLILKWRVLYQQSPTLKGRGVEGRKPPDLIKEKSLTKREEIKLLRGVAKKGRSGEKESHPKKGRRRDAAPAQTQLERGSALIGGQALL